MNKVYSFFRRPERITLFIYKELSEKTVKKCSKCKEVKDFSKFVKDKSNKSGYRSCCKKCVRGYYLENIEYFKELSSKLPEKYKESQRIFVLNHTEKKCGKCKKVKDLSKFNKCNSIENGYLCWCKECCKKWNLENKDRYKESQGIFKLNHVEKQCTKCKKVKKLNEFYKARNKKDGFTCWCVSCDKESRKKWRLENRDEILEKGRKYSSENRDVKNKYERERYRTDPMFRVNHSMRYGIWLSLKGNKDGQHWETLVPYKLEGLMKWLEDKFLPGMTWENYGSEWHIDHKRPKSSFSFKSHKDYQFQICWALLNLRPMWGPENLQKSDKIVEDYQMLLEI